MTLKKKIKQILGNTQGLINLLYTSSKIVFVGMAFVFFLSYFFISARFYSDFLFPFFLPLYLSFLLSFILFLCGLSLRFGYKRVPFFLLVIICILWFAMGAFFLISVF